MEVFEPPLSETPSTKTQAPEKFQLSNPKPPKRMPGQTARRPVFELGAWCFLGAWSLVLPWCLELGIWSLLPGLSASQKLTGALARFSGFTHSVWWLNFVNDR